MKIKYCIVVIFQLLLTIDILAQQSFELTFGVEGKEANYFSFEDNGNFVTVGGRSLVEGYERRLPLIVKIDPSGEIIGEMTIFKQDTSFSIRSGFLTMNGNYLLLGTLSDSVTVFKYNVTYLCEMTPDLNIVWEKMYPIPFPTHHSTHRIENYLITPNDEIIIEGRIDTSLYDFNDILYLAKYDMEGNQIIFKPFMDWKDSMVGSDLIFNPDSTGFYLFGNLAYGSTGYAKNWVEFDIELNIVDHGLMQNWLSYLYTPLTVSRLINGNIIMANNSSEINGNQQHDLEMRIIDQELNLIKDTLLLHEEYVSIPDHRGMGVIDENNIWVATFEDTPPSYIGTEVFRFFIFDSNLNLKGMKVYGGDTRYWFFDLLTTSDGGCLLTGIVPEYEGSDSDDNYLIKVMPSDIITKAEETPYENDMDVFVYPNPFSSELKTETMRTGLTLTLFDSMGRLALKKQIGDIPCTVVSTGNLIPGLYFYQIYDNNIMMQIGKLMKQ